MTRFSKLLVLAGAATMAASPVVASASGSSLPVMLQGGAEDGENSGLLIGGIVVIGGLVALLASGNGKSN